MSTTLNEVTFRRLHEFRRRRLTLAKSRGWSAVISVFVGTLLLAVVVDALSTNEVLRWTASGLVYAATLVTWCLCCWFPSRRREPLQFEAKRFEEADPRLREQLLTAVEFADDNTDQPFDSPAFKDQLQSQVASLIAPVDVKQLLPWRLIRRALLVAISSLALLFLLALIPQLHWMNRVARALLPAANLDRVASIAIVLEEPQPNSRVIAAGDIVGVVARIDGRSASDGDSTKMLLETRAADGEVIFIPMQPQSPASSQASELEPSTQTVDRFHATIRTAEEWIEYRVTGAGAATRWHRLTTQPRPSVERFEVTLTPPGYTKLPSVVQSTDGHIRALVGTHVQLKIAVNQPVSVAEMRWQSNIESPTTFREDPTSKLYVAEFTISQSDAYRIHLQSVETGFANDFSSAFDVEAIADQPPEIVWIKPASSKQIVASDQILSLAAQAQDEFPIAACKQLLRVNEDGSWITTDLDAATFVQVEGKRSDAAEALAGARNSAVAEWPVDLLKTSTRVGDVVEMKLIVEDSKGQTKESEVIEFLISESSITSLPTPAEIWRQKIAAEIEGLDQRIKQQVSVIEELAKPKESSPNEADRVQQSERLMEASKELGELIVAEVPKILELIQQAASQIDDRANLLELEQAGLSLAMLQLRSVLELATATERLAKHESPLSTKRRAELEKEISQYAKRMENFGSGLSSGFRAMVSHDVGRRISGQVAQLQQLFANFLQMLEGTSPQDLESANRQAVVLSRQLLELQQSMLDSLPAVRQETKQRVRQNADSIGNLVAQFDGTRAQADIAKLKAQVEQIEKNLAQLKSASAFDGGLHDAIVNGHRKFAELAGQPAEPLRRALANMIADKANPSVEIASATIDASLDNLAVRRTLSRSRKEGDRDFTSDLGLANRAVRAIAENVSLAKLDQHRELSESAAAIETLQSVHGVNEAITLLDELLRGERWSLNSNDSRIHHPVMFESFNERLDSAVKLLRQTKVPQEIVNEIERLKWHEATSKAGQKINSRRWENAASVSTAAELNQVSELLATARTQLEPHAELARAVLAKQAPSLEQLATKAAEATRDLQKHTAALAEAVERKEIPEAEQQFLQLQAEQTQTQQPINQLRDALVDHADAQNLLDAKQLMTAREADSAIAVVDSAKQDIEGSMQSLATPVDAKQKNASLVAAADQQNAAASKLEQLVEHLQRAQQAVDSSKSVDQPEQPSASDALMQLAQELGENSETQKRFNEAEQLARLSAARPEEVLRQLEQKLATNKPMQQEMSRISQELAEQALNRLDRAADQQQRMQPQLEASDPKFLAQKNLLLQDLQASREKANQVLSLLVSEAKWTAGAGKEQDAQQRLEASESQLRAAIAVVEKANAERTFDQLRRDAGVLADALASSQTELTESSQKLASATDERIHQNDADLANRRREMQERQRRIAQQDVRNMQQLERNQQQLLRQAENELKQSVQREKSLEQHRSNMQREVDKHPQNESLKQQLKDASRNLAFGEVQRQAAEQSKQELTQRVEQANREREASEKKQQVELSSVNPSVQLSAELAKTAAERSAQLAQQLKTWSDSEAPQLAASATQLQNNSQDERSVKQSVQDSVDDLSRAARHEERLKNQPISQRLAEQSTATENLNQSEVSRAEETLKRALENAQRTDASTAQADSQNTKAAVGEIQSADAAIRTRAEQLRAVLAELKQQSATQSGQPSPKDANSDSNSQLLDAQQLARLLDEVDRQLNQAQKSADTAQPTQQAATPQASAKQTPSTLAAAADKIASQLSRNRAPAPQANPDQAEATESTSANVDPQSPVAVKVVDVNRIGADWGKLRERKSEDMIESRRDSVSGAYRQQIEAYFRSLSERGQTTDVKP